MSITAPGLGKFFPGVSFGCGPAVMCVTKEFLPGVVGAPVMRDAAGFALHLQYTCTPEPLATQNGGLPETIEVELDPDGLLILPYCGSVAWTGGNGLWKVAIHEARPYKGGGGLEYLPKKLTRFVKATIPFQVPKHHTQIGSYTPGAVVTDSGTGSDVALGETGVPCSPGQVFVSAIDLTVFFMWGVHAQ